MAVLPSGGPEGRLLEDLLDAAGVAYASVPVRGAVRMNISVLEPDGTTTKLNEPGPDLSSAEVEALLATTLERADGAGRADWVVGCGSLPPGGTDRPVCSPRHPGARAGGRIAIDSSGAPFAAAVAARPHLIKPNHEELAELVDHDLPTLAHVRDAARELVAGGIDIVAVSLGGDGALLVTPTSARTPRRRSLRPCPPWAPATACSPACSTACPPAAARRTPS